MGIREVLESVEMLELGERGVQGRDICWDALYASTYRV